VIDFAESIRRPDVGFKGLVITKTNATMFGAPVYCTTVPERFAGAGGPELEDAEEE